jgi:hypothetical protein
MDSDTDVDDDDGDDVGFDTKKSVWLAINGGMESGVENDTGMHGCESFLSV